MCTIPQLSELDLTDIDTVAIDLETYDPNLKTKGLGAIRSDGGRIAKEGFVTGIAIATKKQTLYFPIAHHMTDNLNTKETWDYLNEKLFKNKDIRKVFHNAMYDVCWIRSMGLSINGLIVDTMIACSLIDENRFSYTLNTLSWHFLGKGKSEALLTKAAKERGLDPKADMWKMPAMEVGAYAEKDPELTLELWHKVPKRAL